MSKKFITRIDYSNYIIRRISIKKQKKKHSHKPRPLLPEDLQRLISFCLQLLQPIDLKVKNKIINSTFVIVY